MAGIVEMLRLCKEEGIQVRGGEQLTSVSLLYPIFLCDQTWNSNGKAALCLPECSQCIQFPVQRARAGKQKQTASEGRGKWEATGARA